MNTHRTLRLSLIMISLFGIGAAVLYGQNRSALKRSATVAKQSATLGLSLTVPKGQVPMGQIPWVSLTVKNLSNADILFPDEERVHVEGEKGEPPTTLRQRQLTHTLQAGEQTLMGGGYEPTIEQGTSFTRKYDLTKLYDFSKPGKYVIYIEVLDESASKNNAGVWVRSNTVQLEIQ